jgi:chromosome segregation ATPase
VSDHHHYGEYADARHDHRGEYADERHDHDLDYAEKHHRHHDDERAVDELRRLLGQIRIALAEAREDLRDALERIRQLEEQTPEARQAEYEADVAMADAAESEYGKLWRSTLGDYHVASGGAECIDDEQAAEAAPCGCPKKDAMIRHRRSSCTDPVAARLDWYLDGEVKP